MTILITGPTGAIGHYVLEQVLAGDDKVRVLALPETLHRLPYRNQIETIPGAFEDDVALVDAVTGVDVVYHTATMSPPPVRRHEEMWRLNAEGTRRLLEACAGEVRRFVFMSSVNVHTPHRTPSTWPLRASADRLAHGNAQLIAYGEAMIAAEDYVFEASARYGMEYTILRPTTVCGRSARFAEMLIGDLMRNPDRAEPLNRIWGTMQWIHGSDVARAAIIAASHECAKNGAFIVAGTEPMTIFSLLAELWNLTHADAYNPFTEAAEANRPPCGKFDTETIQTALGFVPLISLQDCLAQLLGRYEFFTAASLDLPPMQSPVEFEL
jgi:nucleoside-diphosphate-sugar epimerase